MTFSKIVIKALLLVGLTNALAVEKGSAWAVGNVVSFPGLDGKNREYKIDVLTITGDVNGVEFSHNGTAEEYFAAAKEFDPTFEKPKVKARAIDLVSRDVGLEERAFEGLICSRWERVLIDFIQFAGIALKLLNRTLYLGPRTCTMVACENEAGIWWCNDNNFGIHQHTDWLVTLESKVLHGCYENGQQGKISGQAFDDRLFNVLVHKNPGC